LCPRRPSNTHEKNAEKNDADPEGLRSREALLSRLRELRGGDTAPLAAEEAAVTAEGPRVGAMMALADLALAHSDFWTGAPVQALPAQAELPVDLLLRQLPVPGAPLGGPDLVTYLAPLYAVFAEPLS